MLELINSLNNFDVLMQVLLELILMVVRHNNDILVGIRFKD